MTDKSLTQLGTNPMPLITQMRSQLNETIAKSYSLKKNEESILYINQLHDAYLKVNMLELTSDKKLIAITGLQGVGKTKLVRDLYNLDDSLLPSDGGRGEAMPVLFTETEGIEAPEYFVRRAEKQNNSHQFTVMDYPIVSLEEFNRLSMNPEKNDLWLEVKLPPRHFRSEISLLLLPGYERDNGQKSQKYLDLLLGLSTSIMLVFNHKKLAQSSQHQLIKKIANEYRDTDPLFALSFAEELDAGQREKLIRDISEDFNISESEMDRFIFTGTSKDLSDYPQKIIAAIQGYSMTNANGYQKQLSLLFDLAIEIENISMGFEKELQIQQLKQISEMSSGEQLDSYEIHQAFLEFRKNVAKETRNHINKAMTNHAYQCSAEMDTLIANEKNSLFDAFKKAFSKNLSFKEVQAFKTKTTEMWQGENNVAPEKILISSLNTFIKEKSRLLAPSKAGLVVEKKSNPLFMPVVTTEKGGGNHPEQVEKPDQYLVAAISNMNNYMNGDKNDLAITINRNDLKALPLLAVGITQELIASSMYLENKNYLSLTEDDRSSLNVIHRNLLDGAEDLQMSSSTILKGTAIFFGIDSLDGTFNSIGSLTSLLTSLEIPVAAAAPIVGVIVGSIGSALAINKGMERIERYKFSRSDQSKAVFREIASIQEESVILTVENILDKMEERLVDAFHSRRGTDENFGRVDELRTRLSRLQLICGNLKEIAFRNESYIG